MVIGGSNSKESINKQLAIHAANQLQNTELNIVDLNDFALPLYGVDLEAKQGIPEGAKKFNAFLQSTDGIVLSLAEHNGAYSTAFKNILDWISRIDTNVWKEKPMLLMATSPGERGGTDVLGVAKNRFPHLGGNIIATFSLPSFFENFSNDKITHKELETELNNNIQLFQKAIDKKD